MPNHPAPARANTTPVSGWAGRVLRQQLDALSRLTAAAWRLIDRAPGAESLAAATVSAGILGLEKALRLHARVTWALRLIDALRAKLLADLRTVESGQAPAPPIEARSVADAERPMAEEAGCSTDRPEPVERPERRESPERERFGFGRRAGDNDLAEILQRPVAEIIALICRELGLPPDWPQRAEAAWAREAAEDDTPEQPCPSAPSASPSPAWRLAAPS